MDNQTKPLRILILEDVPTDAELAVAELKAAKLAFSFERVAKRTEFEQAFAAFKPDIVLADYNLPGYSGRDALIYSRSKYPQVPVIMVTGAMGDEEAIEMLKLGATDYVLKTRLVKLAPAVTRALAEQRNLIERARTEEKLRDSELRYRRLFESAKDGILILDAETGKIVDANPFILHLLSYTLEEISGKVLGEIGLFKDTTASLVAFEELQQKRYIRYEDLPLETKNGLRIDVEFVSNLYPVGERNVIQCNIRDITERKRVERVLREEQEFSDKMVQSLPDSFYLLDHQGRLLRWNRKGAELLGLSPEEMAKSNVLAFIHEEDRAGIAEKLKEAFAAGSATTEARVLMKNGVRNYHFAATKIETLLGENLIGIGVDITDRKRAEVALRESENTLRSVVENAPVRIFWKDRDLRYLGCNTLFAQDAGLTKPDELIGKTDFDLVWKDQAALYAADDKAVMESGKPKLRFEEPQTTPDGHEIWLRTSKVPLRDANQQVTGILGLYEDITESKRSEQALFRANRALKTLSAGNLALVRATSEDGLLHDVTNVLVEKGGYSMAAVYYTEDDAEKTIVSKVASGIEGSYYADIHLSWADTETNQLPLQKAIRSGTIQICHNIANDPAFKPWREVAQQRGYVANIAFPLSDGGKTFGGLSIYASEPNAFDANEVGLLEEMANDLAYGILMLRVRSEQQQSAATLRQSLEQFIGVIAGTLEARDPYTAGHQRRVAELATAIAREMQLPEAQIEGIRLAGLIHDLGKIQIPAEILSKPTKLSDIEFMLIKTHSQAGYEILKGVKFPWPIADIVRQHHEKLDGSGYPQGLRDEQILLESKIMAVADVVEAMSSHRPYRPALGIEAAFAEIARLRGSAYDAVAVDTCVALFRENKFQFSL